MPMCVMAYLHSLDHLDHKARFFPFGPGAFQETMAIQLSQCIVTLVSVMPSEEPQRFYAVLRISRRGVNLFFLATHFTADNDAATK